MCVCLCVQGDSGNFIHKCIHARTHAHIHTHTHSYTLTNTHIHARTHMHMTHIHLKTQGLKESGIERERVSLLFKCYRVFLPFQKLIDRK